MTSGSSSNKGRIEKKVFIQASAEVVFAALTNAKALVRWFCDRASSEPCQGGEFVACWKTGNSLQQGRAVYTRLVKDSVVEMLWIDDGQGAVGDTKHILSYTIRSQKGATELIMRDDGNPPLDDDNLAFLSRGWTDVMFELKDYCERKERSVKSHPAKDLS